MTGAERQKCPIVGVLPVAEYPHQEPYPGAAEARRRLGLLGAGPRRRQLRRHGQGVYLVGDWCSGRLFGVGWDTAPRSGRCRSCCRRSLQFTAGNVDEDGNVLAVNCYCFYTDDKGPIANPPARSGASCRPTRFRPAPRSRKVKIAN